MNDRLRSGPGGAGGPKTSGLILALFLGVLLALAVAGAVHVWHVIGDVEMSALGIFAMVGGALATLGLGMGLMWLIFRSERR